MSAANDNPAGARGHGTPCPQLVVPQAMQGCGPEAPPTRFVAGPECPAADGRLAAGDRAALAGREDQATHAVHGGAVGDRRPASTG